MDRLIDRFDIYIYISIIEEDDHPTLVYQIFFAQQALCIVVSVFFVSKRVQR
jgi:hypothetical protein